MDDITTLGVKLGYGVESTAGTKPTTFTWLPRCKSIGGVSLETEQIDVSALEDAISKYKKGRQDTGGTWEVTFGLGDKVIEALKAMMSAAAEGEAAGKAMWFEVWFPDLDPANSGFFIIAQPGGNIPSPEVGQNEAAEVAMSFIINDYKGIDTGIEPTAAAA